MRNLMKIAFLALVMTFGATSAFAQSAPTRTTLSSAISTPQQTQIVVASATGIAASSSTSPAMFLMVDHELLAVRSISGTTATVVRGQGGSVATQHKSGETVIVGAGATWSPNSTGSGSSGVFLGTNAQPRGACTRANQQYLPLINLGNATTYNCLGGNWTEQTLPDDITTRSRVCNVNMPASTYFINGTVSTASFSIGVSTVPGTSGNMYISSIYVPHTRWVTGISVLNGTVVGTSLTLVSLYDATGTLLANSSTAGVTGGTVQTVWDIPFGTALMVTGPARYYFGASSAAGTGAFMLMGVANLGDVTGKMTAGTFGTLPNLVVPTAFTSVQTPIGCIY
jgi:hypothetical protein